MEVVDKKQADPILVNLSERYRKNHNDHIKAEKALDRELYRLVGLKPRDKVIYQSKKCTVEDVAMPFLCDDENYQANVYITLRHGKNRRVIHFSNNKEIIKL